MHFLTTKENLAARTGGQVISAEATPGTSGSEEGTCQEPMTVAPPILNGAGRPMEETEEEERPSKRARDASTIPI